MKRRIVVIVFIFLLVSVGVLFFAPITFAIKKQITISASITAVADQITDLRNWPNWNEELKKENIPSLQNAAQINKTRSHLHYANVSYDLIRQSAAAVLVKVDDNGAKKYHSIFILPDSNINFTTVFWIENLSPASWIKEKIHSSGKIEVNLNSLKNYMEDPRQYYGFNIILGKVEDSVVITEITTVAKNNKSKTLSALYQDIVSKANANNIRIDETNSRIAHFYQIGKDSLRIMAAISVDKRQNPKNDLDFLEMPPQGKMLYGYYEGAYNGIQKLYYAMNKYMDDKHLKLIAVPYEKYLSNPRSAEDSLHMKIKLCYPVL